MKIYAPKEGFKQSVKMFKIYNSQILIFLKFQIQKLSIKKQIFGQNQAQNNTSL